MTPMTTQLTEAGQKLADALDEARVVHRNKAGAIECSWQEGTDLRPGLNTAAQILLPPEGGGMREEARGYFDSLMQIVGWLRDAQRIPKPSDAIGLDDIDDDEIEAAAYFIDRLAGLAPKTSVPGNDAGMREAAQSLLDASIEDYGLDHDDADDESVATGRRSDIGEWRSAVTFGHLRRLKAALSPPTGSAGDDETGVREGRWVPNDPTEGMLDAYWSAAGESREMRSRVHATAIRYYRAMIAAAPTALAPQPPKAETPAGAGEPSEVLFKALRNRTYFQRQPASVVRRQAAFLLAALSLAPAARAGDGVDYPHLPLRILETEDRHGVRCPILIADAADNDVAEFFHSEQASVGQSYDQALSLARRFVTLTAAPAANGEGA